MCLLFSHVFQSWMDCWCLLQGFYRDFIGSNHWILESKTGPARRWRHLPCERRTSSSSRNLPSSPCRWTWEEPPTDLNKAPLKLQKNRIFFEKKNWSIIQSTSVTHILSNIFKNKHFSWHFICHPISQLVSARQVEWLSAFDDSLRRIAGWKVWSNGNMADVKENRDHFADFLEKYGFVI